MRNVFAILICLLCFSGCAIKPITQAQYEQIKRIGVVSVVGEKLKLNHFGPTIFNIDRYQLDSSLNVDQFIIETITKELMQGTPFEVVEIEYNYNEVTKVNEAFSGFTNAYEALDSIKEELKEIINKHSLGALILVMRKQTPNTTLNNVDGFGVLEKSIVLYRECHAHMFAIAILIDGKSIKPISRFGYYKHDKIENDLCPEGLVNCTEIVFT